MKFESIVESPRNRTPERQLLAELLFQAINDILSPRRKVDSGSSDQSSARKQARHWILSRRFDPKCPFTFEWVCEHLELSPIKIRMAVRCMDRMRLLSERGAF